MCASERAHAPHDQTWIAKVVATDTPAERQQWQLEHGMQEAGGFGEVGCSGSASSTQGIG